MKAIDKALVNKYSINYANTVRDWAIEHIYSDFTLQVKLDWSLKRRCSRGGMYADGPGINMAMAHAYKDYSDEIYRFREYASFDADKSIGGFYAKDPYLKLECIILHEIAHALQFLSYRKNGVRCKPHGPVFKNFYKRLRTEFLNHKLPNQTSLQKEYDDYVNKLNRGVDHVIRDIMARAASK